MTERITAVDRPDVYLERVDVTFEKGTDKWTPDHYLVCPVWAGVDRPCTEGTWAKSAGLANRLKRAIEAGVAYGPAEVRTGADGKTYVNTPSKFLARRLNADLRILGF